MGAALHSPPPPSPQTPLRARRAPTLLLGLLGSLVAAAVVVPRFPQTAAALVGPATRPALKGLRTPTSVRSRTLRHLPAAPNAVLTARSSVDRGPSLASTSAPLSSGPLPLVALAAAGVTAAGALLHARPSRHLALLAASGASDSPSRTSSFDPLDPLSDAPQGAAPRSATILGRPALWGAGAVMSLLVAGAALAVGSASEAPKGLGSNFDVEFAGLRVDHKLLITLVIIGQFIGFIGAYVGGAASRDRQQEAEVLARKLMVVNQQLRQNRRRALQRTRTQVDNTEAGRIVQTLKDGKAMLKDRTRCREALTVFQGALKATQTGTTLGDRRLDLQRKAFRGMGAALQQLGRYDGAVKALEQVIAITQEIGDKAGVTDAYGAMADTYAESGQLAKAAKYYDLYLESLDAEMADENLEASRYRL